MAFDDLMALTPLSDAAQAYSNRCLALSQATIGAFRTALDIPYGVHRLQRIDVIAPLSATQRPVLLFFHGGGFTHGYKEWGGFIARSLGGVVLVLADYRLVPEVETATQMADAAAALDWTISHAGAWGGDVGRLYVGGHSAGGAMAALLALDSDRDVRGAICLSTSFNRLAVSGTAGAAFSLPPGPLPIDAEAPLARIGDIRGRRFFIAWGGRERQLARVERSSMAMINALRDRDLPVEWHIDGEADHFDTHLCFADPRDRWSLSLNAWLHAQIADPAPDL